MYRKYLFYLSSWKTRSNRKPLVIRGARQVGKTYLVREFARMNYENFIEINFDETPDKKSLFDSNDIDTILQFIALDSGVPVVSGHTLIFLDEIQQVPEVFAKLRYFFEKRNDIHIITAGSLLDLVLDKHEFSMPVGRIEYMHMGPMDFKEYLMASGSKDLCHFIEKYKMDQAIPLSIHNKLLDHLRIYMSIGGMPASLREYIESKSYEQCEMELSSILSTYKDDFSKYHRKIDSRILQLVFEKAPGLVGKKLKYVHLSRDLKAAVLKESVVLLEKAHIIYRVFHSSGNGIPLGSEKKEQDSKLLFLDIGLMMRALGLSILDLQNEEIILGNRGGVAEQFIGQQLLSNQAYYSSPELYYWNREKSGSSSELDYLIQMGGVIIPIEVKSGTTGSLKSLHTFASEKKTNFALRFNLDTPTLTEVTTHIPKKEEHSFKLLSLPLYLVSEAENLLKSFFP